MFKQVIKSIFKFNNWRCLKFERIINKWYVKLNWWPFKHDHLEMVGGSDDFLTFIEDEYSLCSKSKGSEIGIKFKTSNTPLKIENSFECVRTSKKLFKGAFYKVTNTGHKLFLCPVTLFVLGHYPKYIYISDYFIIKGKNNVNNN